MPHFKSLTVKVKCVCSLNTLCYNNDSAIEETLPELSVVLVCLELADAATDSGCDWIDISNADNSNTMKITFNSPHTTNLYEHFPSSLVSCCQDILDTP